MRQIIIILADQGALVQGRTVLGYFGEIHPAIAQHFDIKGACAGFELFFQSVPTPKDRGPAKPLLSMNSLQALSRDFAFVVDEAISADALMRAVKAGGKPFVSDVRIFDVYAGEKMEDGKKSVALNVTIQPQKKLHWLMLKLLRSVIRLLLQSPKIAVVKSEDKTRLMIISKTLIVP